MDVAGEYMGAVVCMQKSVLAVKQRPPAPMSVLRSQLIKERLVHWHTSHNRPGRKARIITQHGSQLVSSTCPGKAARAALLLYPMIARNITQT